MSPQDVRTELAAYEGSIAYIDHQIGSLMAELERRGDLGNTLVIITSDHGEHFGEHRLFGHGNSLYRQLLHVPLLILFPEKLPAGKRIGDIVSLRDIPATVLDILGLEVEAQFPGSSLVRFVAEPDGAGNPGVSLSLSEVTGRKGIPDWYPVINGDMQCLIAGGMHYIQNGDGSEELYDFENDILEEHDLSRSAPHRNVLGQLRNQLNSLTAKSVDLS